MKKLFATIFVAGAALATASVAEARQGCGPGGHRGPYGHCRPNNGGRVIAPGLVIGNFYHGRGYWDGRRYWQHRNRDHRRGWRYY
ncbi:GCG_CRPN prefix-to-repeats domain-containing protein [Novosphingobium lentum]|uniref:GCG_CRPN prefix-to-repeats domain-containing protein n=1 Tax=Novosphingobium lentum TaxID=145287 RepID=UPI00082CF128|nr:hypothetical protein [Novosphingobium lentum]